MRVLLLNPPGRRLYLRDYFCSKVSQADYIHPPIDLVFLNKEKKVVHVEEHFRPFRISKVSLKATSVLELPAHTIYRTGTQVGDALEITSIR